MTLSRVRSRAHRWAGILFVALGVLGLAVAQLLASRPAAANPGGLWWVAGATIALGAATLGLPWERWPHAAALGLAVGALGLLVGVDRVSGYSRTSAAAATYPVYVLLILAWVGLTQPRRTALAFTLCVGAVLALVALSSPDSAIPLSALAVILPGGAALGEAGAWLMSEVRAAARRDSERAQLLADLARMLEQLPERASLGDAAQLVATMARRVFASPAAQVVLVDRDGGQVTRTSGDASLLADVDGRQNLALATGTGQPGDGGVCTLPRVDESRLHITLKGTVGPIGTVAVVGTPLSGDAYATQLARLFASQVGTSVEQFELIRSLDHAVHHDELTGTGNRRHAATLLERLRAGDGVILVDIDRFKDVNDVGGHRAGDALLQALGTYLSSYVRGSDDVARFGGDEFLVVVRGIGSDVSSTASRLLQGWRDLQPKATISIGVAVHRVGDRSEHTLERADAALYRAKGAGRDRLAMAEDDPA
jgi:diguanylate cyclase (GGDEF)-like protein